MRTLDTGIITRAIADLCRTAALHLPADVAAGLERAHADEASPLGRSLLAACRRNAAIAAQDHLPICQDTGTAVVFADLGRELQILGDLDEAIQQGVRQGYGAAHLRASIVADPLFDRRNTRDNTPAIVHLRLVDGDRLHLTLAPKGGGSENWGTVAMLTPAAGREGVLRAVVERVTGAGGNPCPPVVVGVGVGGNLESAALEAKRALLRPLGQPHPEERYAALEHDILTAINASGIGPQGLGGRVTALAVHVEHRPCHIASLPVGIALNCHVARHAEVVL